MPTHPCTRRRFLVSASLLAATAVVPLTRFDPAAARAPHLLISAERADASGYGAQALVLDGPRVERLQAMTDSLAKVSGDVILRLDPVDDHLLDIAAQQAGVSIRRGGSAPAGRGIVAQVSSQRRSFA